LDERVKGAMSFQQVEMKSHEVGHHDEKEDDGRMSPRRVLAR
jgi:hypothetical protein